MFQIKHSHICSTRSLGFFEHESFTILRMCGKKSNELFIDSIVPNFRNPKTSAKSLHPIGQALKIEKFHSAFTLPAFGAATALIFPTDDVTMRIMPESATFRL